MQITGGQQCILELMLGWQQNLEYINSKIVLYTNVDLGSS